MTAITGFIAITEHGQSVAADPHGNNVAFRCESCGGPVLAEIRENQRGSAPEKPTECSSCHSRYWVEAVVPNKQLVVHRLTPVGRKAEVFTERIRSWSDFTDLVEHFSYFNGHAWLFRGARNAAYGLQPKVGRETTRAVKERNGTRERVPYRPEDERAAFTMFKQQARAHLIREPQSDLEWLAIAQHHGMPTRLLDWTESLLVAAWFAVELGGAKDYDSAIWVARGIPPIGLGSPRDPLAPGEVSCYRPPHISPRISAQSSVFVLCPDPIIEIIPPFVRQIRIEPKVQFTLKKRLNACGLNMRTLFPDLPGLSDHLGWLYKHDWLAGYRPDCSPTMLVADASPSETE